MEMKTVCLIRLPSEDALLGGGMGAQMPPLSLGIITSYLRERGIAIDPYDLMPRMEEIYGPVKERSPFEAFFDKQIVFDYVNGGPNPFFEEFVAKLLEGIDIRRYDLIAFSVGSNLSWIQTHGGVIFGEYIRRRWPKPMVFGGINFSPMMAFQPVYDELFALFIRNFSYVIGGPGEEPLYQLIKGLEAGKCEAEIRQIKGMCSLDAAGRVVCNPQEKRRIIQPDFRGLRLEDYYNYLKKDAHAENMITLYRHSAFFTRRLRNPGPGIDQYEKKLVIPYIFNYNCPYNCAFCAESNPDAPTPVIGSVEQVIGELRAMKTAYDTPYFYFINNAVNCSKKFIIALCRAIIDEGLEIYWSDCARFDNVDYEILQLMKQAGCQKLVFGMETGSPALVKRINKKIDLGFAEQVLAWCSEIGIWAELEIIAGMPSETEEDFQENYEYLKRNLKNISYMTVNHYIPLPGSLMFRYPEKFNIEIGDRATYEDILARDLAPFKEGKNPAFFNNMNKIYRYRDKEQRDFNRVTADTVERVRKMTKLIDGKLIQEALKYIQQGMLKMDDLQNLKAN